MNPFARPPIFVVGAQRSGTTWVQRLLADHPALVGGQESHLFSGYLAPLWQRWQEEAGYRQQGRTIGLACYLTEAEFLEELRGLAGRTLGKLSASKPGAVAVVEKTPDHGLHLPLIHRLFPEAVIIHVLRDARDVVASLRQASRQRWGQGWTPADAAAAAQRWVEYVQTISRDMRLFSRSVEIRYETLVEQGPAELARLFQALELPLPAGEVEVIHDRWRFEACSAGLNRDSLIVAGACQDRPTQEPPGFFRKGRPGTWSDDLSPAEIARVQAIAGPLLAQLGYPLSDAGVPARWRRLLTAVPRQLARLLTRP